MAPGMESDSKRALAATRAYPGWKAPEQHRPPGRHRAPQQPRAQRSPRRLAAFVAIAGALTAIAGVIAALTMTGTPTVALGDQMQAVQVTSSATTQLHPVQQPLTVATAHAVTAPAAKPAKPAASLAPATARLIPTPASTPTHHYTAPATTPAAAPAPTHSYVAPSPSPVRSSPVVTVAASGDGGRLLAEAETRAGDPYVYATDGPTTFDCSGLIYWAANQIGITGMPRDTYSMLGQGVSSGLLVAVSHPEPGDLAFFGSGHVELYIKSGETFGAQQPGTNVGFHSYGYSYVPTAFYRVR